jgi:hypothetical protein
VNFQLDDETAAAAAVARDWARGQMKPRFGLAPGSSAASIYEDTSVWRSFTELGLLDAEHVGGTLLDEVAGVIEAVKYGMPGPVLEADLAIAAGSADALDALRAGKVVTSARAARDGETVVAWGACADLVVDQSTGATIATGRLPRVPMSHPLPHGWIAMAAAGGADRLATRRWILGSALLVGLSTGAVEMAAEYVRGRIQFGRPIGDRQAIQLRLAEAFIGVWAARQAVIDAAWRASSGRRESVAAAALCWLWTEGAARRASRHCHQAFGALGFCEEAGLVRLTAQIDWLCAAIGRRAAEEAAVRDRVPDPALARTRVFESYAIST